MVATLSQKELVSQVREKGWEVTRGEKPKPPTISPEVKHEKLVKSIIATIDDLKLKLERDSLQSKVLSANLVLAAKIMAELGKTPIEPKTEPKKTDEKRKWNMDVVRDSDGLIKSIVAEEI